MRWTNMPLTCTRYPHWMFTTSDGNFHATSKNKPMDDTDFPLTMGAGSFPYERDYKVFLANVKPQKEVGVMSNLDSRWHVLTRSQETSCSRFGAMGYGRFGGRVAGMVGLTCARHMFVLPCGCVDLPGAEA